MIFFPLVKCWSRASAHVRVRSLARLLTRLPCLRTLVLLLATGRQSTHREGDQTSVHVEASAEQASRYSRVSVFIRSAPVLSRSIFELPRHPCFISTHLCTQTNSNTTKSLHFQESSFELITVYCTSYDAIRIRRRSY